MNEGEFYIDSFVLLTFIKDGYVFVHCKFIFSKFIFSIHKKKYISVSAYLYTVIPEINAWLK